MGMAAAAIYIACLQQNEKITQKEIAEVAGVTEVTVRNRYKELKKQLHLLTPVGRFVYKSSDNKPSFCQ
jgi:transcription initiation factor TFIIB